MADAAFDTLAATHRLTAKGFSSDKANLAELEARITWRIIIVGLALNSASVAAVIAAVGWVLSGN